MTAGVWAHLVQPSIDVDRVRQAILDTIIAAGARGCDERDLARALQLPASVINARIGELLLAGYVEEAPSSWVATPRAVRVS